MAWAADYSEPQVRLIGGLEIFGARGLILPLLLRTAELLAPLAAVGLTIVMIGAVVVHPSSPLPVR
jgi:hypothetical protein